LAADALLLSRAARDQAVRGGQDRDAHAAEHARQAILARVDPASRFRDALQIRDHERLVRGAVLDVVVADVALLLEEAGDLLLHARVRHLHVVVERAVRVPDPAEHVCDWVSQHRLLLYLPSEAIGTNQLGGKCEAFFIVTTSCFSSCREPSPREQARAGRSGKGRTCERQRAAGRNGGSACRRAPCTSAGARLSRSGISSPLALLVFF